MPALHVGDAEAGDVGGDNAVDLDQLGPAGRVPAGGGSPCGGAGLDPCVEHVGDGATTALARWLHGELGGDPLGLEPETVRLICVGRPRSSRPVKTRTSHTPIPRWRIVVTTAPA